MVTFVCKKVNMLYEMCAIEVSELNRFESRVDSLL